MSVSLDAFALDFRCIECGQEFNEAPACPTQRKRERDAYERGEMYSDDLRRSCAVKFVGRGWEPLEEEDETPDAHVCDVCFKRETYDGP